MDLIEATDVSPQHRHPWETARLWVLRRLLRGRVTIGDGDTVIDIGCGDAFVLGELARAYPRGIFYGIDAALTPETVTARQGALPPNLQLRQSLDDLPPMAQSAALILLMDVIEHIEDDRGFLIDLASRAFVGARTQVLITVPAYQGLFSSHDVFLKHFRRYSNQQLQQTVEAAGLAVEDVGYFFTTLLPLRMLQVAKERLTRGHERATAKGLSGYAGGALATALMARWLIADAYGALALHRLGITVPGLSNYAVCRTSA